jgi:hypothetical protein
MTDLSRYTKKLVLPDGFDPPRRLVHEDIVAHAITRDDLAADVRGINASLDLYLYPMGVRRPLTADLARHDVDVSWWVTPDAYRAGYYAKTHLALQRWATEDFPFTAVHDSNQRIPPA